jgi:hypothetical protein
LDFSHEGAKAQNNAAKSKKQRFFVFASSREPIKAPARRGEVLEPVYDLLGEFKGAANSPALPCS